MFLFLFSKTLLAAETRNGIWSQLILNGSTDSYLYLIQPQLRFNDGNAPIDEYLIDFALGHDNNAWSFWLGVRYEVNSLDAEPDDHEMRLWEQLLWKSTDSDVLQFRTRLEQRKSLNYSGLANRIRQQGTVNSPYRYGFRMVLSDEIFINLNRVSWITTKTVDQNRVYAGIEHKFNDWMTFGAGYLNQYIFSSPAQSNNMLQLSVSFNLSD